MKKVIKIGSFKERLDQALKIKNMKPIDLSIRTGIYRSSISQYLSGKNKPNADNLYKLSIALDVNPRWLLGYDEVKS